MSRVGSIAGRVQRRICSKAVSAHEKSMREQAKKMNVASLRSADAQQKSAEGKLAKASSEKLLSLEFVLEHPY